MTDDEIATLARSDESDRVERKESLSDRVRKAICAFANDLAGHRRPGLVLVGQRDDGSCANLTINDQLLTALAGIRVESAFAPFPSIDVRRMTINGCEVAAIIVHVASSPPVRYDGRIWVRVGPTTRIATPEEEQRLSERRRAAHLPFDVQAVAGASLADLDLVRFRQEYLPSVVAPDDLIEANIRTSLDVAGRTTHAAHPDYPADALRQVTRNAVMHRTYGGTHAPVKVSWFTDRIEVMSPGGPFGQVTIERFGAPGMTDS